MPVEKFEKIVRIPVSAIIINRDENVREANDTSYALEALMADIALRGQTDAVTVEKRGNNYFPLKGFRRSEALKRLAESKIIDPKTEKPFDTVNAIVYEGLTAQDRVKLLLDHGQRKSLNKLELFFAECKAFEAGYNERDVAIILRSLFENHYPPSRKVKETYEDNGKDLLDYYRGVIQTAKMAWLAPIVLQDAWKKKLKDGIRWPSNAELRELYQVYESERKEDKANRYNQEKPGPKFMQRWNQYLTKQAEAADNGEKRGKADSMMNRQQVEDVKKQTKSRVLMTFNDIITRRLSADKLPILDSVCMKLEAAMTDDSEIGKLFNSLFTEVEAPKSETEAK